MYVSAVLERLNNRDVFLTDFLSFSIGTYIFKIYLTGFLLWPCYKHKILLARGRKENIYWMGKIFESNNSELRHKAQLKPSPILSI